MANQDPQTPPQEPQNTPPPQAPGPVPYERFKEINDRAKALETRLAEFEKGEKERADAALKEQNKWRELYEQRESELKKERTNSLKLKIASSKGLPADLFDRLRGETEEEIAKDAEGLLAFLKAPTTPPNGVPPHNPNGPGNKFDFAAETDPAKIREQARKKQS